MSDEANPSITDLARAAKDGDSSAWEAIVDRRFGSVWKQINDADLTDTRTAYAARMIWLRTLERLSSTEPEDFERMLDAVVAHEIARFDD